MLDVAGVVALFFFIAFGISFLAHILGAANMLIYHRGTPTMRGVLKASFRMSIWLSLAMGLLIGILALWLWIRG